MQAIRGPVCYQIFHSAQYDFNKFFKCLSVILDIRFSPLELNVGVICGVPGR